MYIFKTTDCLYRLYLRFCRSPVIWWLVRSTGEPRTLVPDLVRLEMSTCPPSSCPVEMSTLVLRGGKDVQLLK